jgi:uncharacterized protein YjbI with pentapeptide repeats
MPESGTGAQKAPIRLTPADVAGLCDANPLSSESKRKNGPLDLRNVDLQGCAFKDLDLSDSDLSGAQLQKSTFERIIFKGSNLTGANIEGAKFDNCDFSQATLRGMEGAAVFDKPDLTGAVIAGLDLQDSDIFQSSILAAIDWHLARYRPIQAMALGLAEDHNSRLPDRRFDAYKFGGRDLPGFDFQGASLVGASFSSAVLTGANLDHARLDDADLSGADLSNVKAPADQVRAAQNWLWARYDGDLRIALRLPADHNERRKQQDFSGYDLSALDLRKTTLIGVNLRGAYLARTNLAGLNLASTNFEGAELAGAIITGANLANANLSDVDLSGVDFQKMNLSEANFRGARLVGADFSGLTLKGVKFEGADLTGAKFRGAKLKGALGLEAWQFRGADVTEAELPEPIAEFKSVELVSKIAPAAAKQFLATDVSLILGSATQKLPIVQTEIPIVGFYWFAPFVLVIAALYFQLNLHGMWEALAKLPAIFPDGRRIDEHVYPWLLMQKVRAHYPRLQNSYTLIPQLDNRLGSLLAYGAVPVTLLAFWFRAGVRHGLLLSGWHVLLVAIAGFVAAQFHQHATDTLCGVPLGSGWQSFPSGIPAKWWTALIASGLALALITGQTAMRTFYLHGAELTTKPAGWKDEQVDLSNVTGANLFGANLDGAWLDGAFLVKADLASANLGEASLRRANLRDANLIYAKLEGAKLELTDLRGANLTGATGLTESQLREAVCDERTSLPEGFAAVCKQPAKPKSQ